MNVDMINIKGLNTRRNKIAPVEGTMSDCLNVFKDANGNIRKISEFQTLIDPTAFILDSYYSQTKNELLLVTTTGIKKVSNIDTIPVVSSIDCIFAGSEVNVYYTGRLSFAEYGHNIYMADPSGKYPVMKYDGHYIYRAGLPQANITLHTAGSVYVRAFVSHKDANGNETFGDYDQTLGTIGTNITVDYIGASTNTSRYPAKYGYPGISIRPAEHNAEISAKVATFTEHNFEIGDIVWVKVLRSDIYGNNYTKEWPLTVSYVSGLDVIFTYPDLELDDIIITSNALSQVRLNLYSSSASTYGYETNFSENYHMAPNSPNSFPVQDLSVALVISSLNEIYDDTVVKGEIPDLRYIAISGLQMVGVGEKDSDTIDTMFWSDLGVGSTVETFAPFDYQQFGSSYEGDCTGVFVGKDHFVLFKERDIYFIYGILYGKQYRIVQSNLNGIGCISHKTIKKTSGGCVFLSDKGLYFTSGAEPTELSDDIQPTIEAIPNKDQAYIEIDARSERMFIVFPSITVEYSIYWKEFFLNDTIGGEFGLAIVDDKYFNVEETLISSQRSTFNSSAFFTLNSMTNGAPTLKQKFNNIILLSAYEKDFDISVDFYENWKTTPTVGDEVDSFSSDMPVVSIGVPNKTNYALGFKVSGSNNAEDMLISGFAVDVEPYQSRTKDRSK